MKETSANKCPKITRLPRLCKIDVKDLLPIRDPDGTNSYITVGQLIDLVNTYFNLGSCVPSTLVSSNILLGNSSLLSKEFNSLLNSAVNFKANLVNSAYFENVTQAQLKFAVNLLGHSNYQSFISSILSLEASVIQAAEYELALTADVLFKSTSIKSAQYETVVGSRISFAATLLEILEGLGITSALLNLGGSTLDIANYELSKTSNLTVVSNIAIPASYQGSLTSIVTVQASTFREAVVTYLKVLKEEFYIICPTPRKLDALESDGSSFVWTQLKGTRSIDIQPPNSINPVVDVLSTCKGVGCNANSFDPIVLNVEPVGRPNLKQEITIYTVPTSTLDGYSYIPAHGAPDSSPPRAVSYNSFRAGAPKPQGQIKAFLVNPENTFAAAWDLPIDYPEYLVKTIWQQNVTGEYVDVETFDKADFRFFVAQLNRHYRIISVFNTNGYVSNIDTDRYYIQNPNKAVAGDDIGPDAAFDTMDSGTTTLPLSRVSYAFPDEFISGYAYTHLEGDTITLPLDVVRLEAPKDTYDTAAAYVSIDSGTTTRDLDGILIR